MAKLLLFIPLFIYFFITVHSAMAVTPFTVTSFDGIKSFTWDGVPNNGCSATNSRVMTYPGNDNQSTLSSCEETYGGSEDVIPDGNYYVFLAIGGQGWQSQVFTIKNGILVQTAASPTQSLPTVTPITMPTSAPTNNQPPIAVPGTSLDTNGELQLDATASSDPENDTLTYSWRISGERSARNGKLVSLKEFQQGTYTVVLKVFDGTSFTTAEMKVGIAKKRPSQNITMKVADVILNKKNGSFSISGRFDQSNPLLRSVIEKPKVRILFEVQTAGTSIAPIYGIIGENTQLLNKNGQSKDDKRHSERD